VTTQAASGDIEIELTYLAREIPAEIRGVKPERLLDAYLPEGDAPTIRVRRCGNMYEITKKTGLVPGDHSMHLDQTIPLDEAEFQALRKAGGRTVEKDRFFVEIDGYPAEVDVFTGDLAGLVLIDFEFPDEEARKRFHPPICCLADVTQEAFVAGGWLAGKTYDHITGKLDKFAYKKLTV
jgi:CYTH domain-containing protein